MCSENTPKSCVSNATFYSIDHALNDFANIMQLEDCTNLNWI